MSKRALIIGTSGQDGSYLAELLISKGYDVHGIERPRTGVAAQGTSAAGSLTRHFGDLSDGNSLLRVIKSIQPDETYNLGAQSQVQTSFDTPESTADITGLGVTRILDALHAVCPKGKFFQASSSEIFGRPLVSPQDEKTPLSPTNPYGCAKAYAYYITRNYREGYGMYAVNGILFNHESPRRGENFVTRKITLALAKILAGKQDCLFLGNLETKRDWGYAKEFVEGMWKMLQESEPDDFVLATGEQHSVREFLELCLDRTGMKWTKQGSGDKETYLDDKGRAIVKIDPTFKRPAHDAATFIGNPTKAKNVLGWQAKTDLKALASIMMESDCQKLGVTI